MNRASLSLKCLISAIEIRLEILCMYILNLLYSCNDHFIISSDSIFDGRGTAWLSHILDIRGNGSSSQCFTEQISGDDHARMFGDVDHLRMFGMWICLCWPYLHRFVNLKEKYL